jgi:hypothetical protein
MTTVMRLTTAVAALAVGLAAPEASEAAGAGLFGPLAAEAAAAAPDDRLAEALLRPAEAATASVGPAVPAAQYPYYGRPRRSGYRAPTGPTRDQTSPLGLEAQVGGMSREVTEWQPDGTRAKFDVDSTRILLKATVRPVRAVELFGLVGAADLDSDFDEANFDTGLDLAYGGGARLTFYRDPEWYDTAVFLEGRYLQHETDGTGEFEEPDPANPTGPPIVTRFDEFIRWQEWEGRLGVSWRFYTLRPYLGIRYSSAEADDVVGPRDGPNERRTMRADDFVGGFLGVDIYFNPSRRVGLTAEVTFPDQVSGHVGLRFWF